MMKPTIKTLAYFDTNVFDNLLKKSGGITKTDEARLRLLIDSKKLSILPCDLNIQETLAALESPRAEFVVVPQLALIERLSDWELFIKPHHVLLTDDVRHFAWNGEATSSFLSEREIGLLHSSVRRVLNGSEDAE